MILKVELLNKRKVKEKLKDGINPDSADSKTSIVSCDHEPQSKRLRSNIVNDKYICDDESTHEQFLTLTNSFIRNVSKKNNKGKNAEDNNSKIDYTLSYPFKGGQLIEGATSDLDEIHYSNVLIQDHDLLDAQETWSTKHAPV